MEKINEMNNASSMGVDSKGKKWSDYETIKCPDGTIIDMPKLLNAQATAETSIRKVFPWLGNFVGKLRVIYTFKVQTQATDGYNLFVNPQFTNNLTHPQKVFVMLHEIMHCLLNHMRRRKGHDPRRSNIAADYECNTTICETGVFDEKFVKDLGGFVDVKKYRNKGYEWIYENMPNESTDGNMSNQQGQKQAQQNQQGQGGSSNQQDQKQKSADYKAGWKKALDDYKKGKLKI